MAQSSTPRPTLERSLLALRGKVAARSAAGGGTLPAGIGDELAQRHVLPTQMLAMRLTGTPASRMSQIVWRSSSLKRLHIRTTS